MKTKTLLFLCYFFYLFLPVKAYTEAPFLIHNQGNSGGMFAEFASVLGSLKSYEQGTFSGVEIDFDTGCYLDSAYGPNWWEYYFEPICVGNTNALRQVCTLEEYLKLAFFGFSLSREESFGLIQKYIHVKKGIAKEIQSFVKKNFSGHFVIGFHYRGTDKIQEHPRTPYKQAYGQLKEIINNLSASQKKSLKVYVATDEQKFIEYLTKKMPELLIYNDFVRSPDTQTPLHYANNFYTSNYQKGREALIDCLLLSKCNILLRPKSSCLSWASTLFNPNLPNVAY